jgi:hypothetical protein
MFGITSVVWMVFQVLIGGGSVWFEGAAFGGGMKAKSLWKYHRCVRLADCLTNKTNKGTPLVYRDTSFFQCYLPPLILVVHGQTGCRTTQYMAFVLLHTQWHLQSFSELCILGSGNIHTILSLDAHLGSYIRTRLSKMRFF